MAGEQFSTISPVLSQYYTAILADQRNVDSKELGILNIKPNDSGKNIAWVAKFQGTRNVTVFAEGSDVQNSEYTKTDKVAATLDFGQYRAPVQVTDRAAILSRVAEMSPDELRSLVDAEIKDGLVEVTKQVAVDFYTGTGTSGGNPNIVGLAGGAALNTGIYAGINRASYSGWSGTYLANGGVLRPVTDDLLRQAESAIFDASGESPDIIFTNSRIHRKYAGIFTPLLRVNTAGQMPAQLAMGTNDLFWGNCPVIRSARAPSNKIFMLSRKNVEFVFPRELLPIASVPQNPMVLRMGLDLKSQYMLPIVVEPLAKTGNALKYNVYAYVQLRVKNPNQVAIIDDVSET